jgi:hypothetical protein
VKSVQSLTFFFRLNTYPESIAAVAQTAGSLLIRKMLKVYPVFLRNARFMRDPMRLREKYFVASGYAKAMNAA